MIDTGFICSDCGKPILREPYSCGGGYGIYDGKKVCYACCAEHDRAHMREHGRILLYYSGGSAVINWPASLSLPIKRKRTSKHNMAGFRTDVWFDFEGREWHGYQIGYRTQICHCRQTKQEARPYRREINDNGYLHEITNPIP